MAVTLLPYSLQDFDTLYAIDQACYPRGIAYSRVVLRGFLTLPDACCLVARTSGSADTTIAGFIVGESAGEDARIITIDVLKDYRRAGVGTILLRGLEERLQSRGVRKVELETATTNVAGVAFWERHGYRKTGVLHGYYLGRLDAWKMRKRF